MNDIEYDLINNEVFFENGDFKITKNPSVQNGGIIEFGHGFNCYYPSLGVGIGNFIGSPLSSVAYYYNLWKQQCKNDGATLAQWRSSVVNLPYVGVNILTNINYL